MRNRSSRGQQEMVGFVLIVVLVTIALVVFLSISLRQAPHEQESFAVSSMLSTITQYTTACAIRFEPRFDTFEDLFKSCHTGQRCSNLNELACDYLNLSLREVLQGMMDTESTISGYQFDLFVREGEGLLRIEEGTCGRSIQSSQRVIVSGTESLVVRLRTCTGLESSSPK